MKPSGAMIATEMIAVAVGVDHRPDRQRTQFLGHQIKRRPGGLGRRQRIDDHPAAVTLDEGDIGDVKAPHLPDPVRNLKEAMARQQLGLTPEAGVHRGGRLALEEIIGRQVPGHLAVGALDQRVGARAQKAAIGEFKVLTIGKRQGLGNSLLALDGRRRGRLTRVSSQRNREKRNGRHDKRRLTAKLEFRHRILPSFVFETL
jgi:hypothetical protein